MSFFDHYLHQVLKGTYLRRREKETWVEEMQSHLEESTARYIEAGLTEEEACQRAISSFGTAREIRRRIIRDTFIISPRWLLIASFLCFIALVMSLYTTMRFHDVVVTPGGPSTWTYIPTPEVVVWLHRYFPLNPNRWAALSVMCLMMLFTRKHVDRWAVLVSGIPFCILQVLIISNPTLWYGARYFFFAAWPVMAPLGIASICGCLMLLVLGVLLYAWTRNRAVSMTPWAITIALTMWPFVRDAVQSALWEWTHNAIFWGHSSPWGWTAWYTLLSVSARLLGLALFFLVCRWIDSMSFRRVNTV